MSLLDSTPPQPHADGRALLGAIGVPDADDWTVVDDERTVGACRRLPQGTSCEVRRRRWGGACRLVIDRITNTRRTLNAPRPDQLLGLYIAAQHEDAAAGGRA